MLKGKTAIVTGASRGIGAAIARTLASMGATVAAVYASSGEAAQAVLFPQQTTSHRSAQRSILHSGMAVWKLQKSATRPCRHCRRQLAPEAA